MLWMCIRMPPRGDSNTHPKHMIKWRTGGNPGNDLVFCENFMSTRRSPDETMQALFARSYRGH